MNLSNTDSLGCATDIVKKAVDADTITDYGKAYQLYYQALELFLLALKWEKNLKLKELIRTKVEEYARWAETLRAYLQNPNEMKPRF